MSAAQDAERKVCGAEQGRCTANGCAAAPDALSCQGADHTVERIAASTEILELLAGQNAFCFAATHDIELTELLKKQYDNYHFEEQVEEDDVIFDYRLREGKAMTRNAIKLLHMIGYDPKIVERAQERVEHFVEHGSWQMQ